MPDRFSPEDHARLRARLMQRGGDLAAKLSEILAGQDGDTVVATLGLSTKPGARPEEILRRALDDNEQLRRWLDDGDPRYGACGVCATPFSIEELRELPWADRCRAHAAPAPAAH